MAKSSFPFSAEQIRAERVRRGLSGGQAAREIGVDQSTMCRWENGKQPRGLLAKALQEWMEKRPDEVSS